MKYIFPEQQIKAFENFLSHEYLLSNGRGGYAFDTLADCHTRKYHGLLALPVPLLGSTYLFLSKLELSVLSGSHQYDLATNRFPGSFFPQGYQYIQMVEIESFPVTTYVIPETGVTLKKSILMPRGENSVLVCYELAESTRPVTLKIASFLAYRDIHGLSRQNADLRPRTYFEPNGFKIDPYENLPPLYIQTSKTSTFYPSPDWWNTFEYSEERRRGYDDHEDLFTPGVFEVRLKKGELVIVRTAQDSIQPNKIANGWEKEKNRLEALQASFQSDAEPLATLKVQASHYITDEPKGVMAGFPWFTDDWGRDTMISIPGLFFTQGYYQEAFDLLRHYSTFEKNGLLPNTVSQIGGHAYNSIDSGLLFIWTVQRYLQATGEKKSVEKILLPTMEKILACFTAGRVSFARVGEDGLLYAGNEKTQLTWMDAQTAGLPVTPRHGAAVEINALFYNALVLLLEEFGTLLSAENQKDFSRIRSLFEKNFTSSFWVDNGNYLADVFRSHTDIDISIRPNQLFALGLAHTCVPSDKALAVLETVKLHLVTPYGLRTLSPRHENFIPVYEGSQAKRDKAYHQGMIWPWLIGIYFDAAKRFTPDFNAVKTWFRNTFSPLWDSHLEQQALFQVSEIFTPVFPHLPAGCPAQAWSMAEVIRVLEETK